VAALFFLPAAAFGSPLRTGTHVPSAAARKLRFCRERRLSPKWCPVLLRATAVPCRAGGSHEPDCPSGLYREMRTSEIGPLARSAIDKVVSMHAHVDPSLVDCIGGRLGRWPPLGRHLLLRAVINFVENHTEFSP